MYNINRHTKMHTMDAMFMLHILKKKLSKPFHDAPSTAIKKDVEDVLSMSSTGLLGKKSSLGKTM